MSLKLLLPSLGVVYTNAVYQYLLLDYSAACLEVHDSPKELCGAIESCRGERKEVKILLRYLWPYVEENTQWIASEFGK